MAQTDFGRVLSRTEVQFKRASDALTQTRLFSEQSNLNAAYEAAFRFEAILEQAVLLARALPAYTGRPKVLEAVDALMEQAIPIEMGYTELGWFCLRIPAFSPKQSTAPPVPQTAKRATSAIHAGNSMKTAR